MEKDKILEKIEDESKKLISAFTPILTQYAATNVQERNIKDFWPSEEQASIRYAAIRQLRHFLFEQMKLILGTKE